ncbi:DsbA family oxidoreductase [Ornithinimicrobium cryptoxanthini]|uniref:DsbA family oxidoreductase n=1 Tax=Ornithinimicrobium cryptoxanthini TaxID=2934161 RepID=A0ABY4YIA0_9MICO|nr:DsbA family oxidoreductase [Ornithinimicrobium cryptoxanthini]USQ76251.1 DsbA family oxidoreductase [Ornithinimicrobium cryptoxanthini]
MAKTLKVDIWSDIACPWCYIGKRKFERAVEEFSADGREVEVEYHSFELAPDTPVDFEGSEVDFLVAHKGMPAEQVEQMLSQVSSIASSVGLDYDFESMQHTNTVRAHQVLHLAKGKGLQVELKERLLKAYFEQGRHVGRAEELADLAAEVGLDRDEVLSALESEEFLPDVRADIAQARNYGISGVPFFVLDRKFGVSGAQETTTFVQALGQAWDEQDAV